MEGPALMLTASAMLELSALHFEKAHCAAAAAEESTEKTWQRREDAALSALQRGIAHPPFAPLKRLAKPKAV